MTGLSLNRWLALMGFNPWHSYQLVNSLIPINASCSTIMSEYDWQFADRAGRSNVRTAIRRAEDLMRQYTLINPAPAYRSATLRYPRLGDTRFMRLADIGADGQWLTVALPEGEIRCLGVPLDSTPTVPTLVYSDEDGDNLFETATAITTVPSGTTEDEVIARFIALDCGPVAPPEVRPRSVTISGVNATIVFDTWTLVRPIRYQGAASGPLDPGNGIAPAATVCAPTIEIFQRHCDPTGTTVDTCMATLTWETQPWPNWGSCCIPSQSNSSDPAATATALCRATIRDAGAGIVAFGQASYDTTTGTWMSVCDWTRCRPPDSVTIRYQAGLPLDGIEMQHNEAVVVARLAAAELARPICACTSANKELSEWQWDISRTGATDQLYAAPNDLTNPLGSRRGQIYAYRYMTRQQLTRGIYAG